MRFSSQPANHATRIAAGSVLLVMSFGLASFPMPAVRIGGVVLFVIALAIVCTHVYNAMDSWLKRRQDPYDLARLWDDPLPESSDDLDHSPSTSDDLTYCHRCGVSTSSRFAVCPDCGHRLGY